MRLPHEQAGFEKIIRDASKAFHVDEAFVEKDYWITHVLWSLHDAGLTVAFKGGTSLSKAFGIIERFSEDLDLVLGSGTLAGMPPDPNWKGDRDTQIKRRQVWFAALENLLRIPDCTLAIDHGRDDERHRSTVYTITYPGLFLEQLVPQVRQHIVLEVGNARVTPALSRSVTSWVHEHLAAAGGLDGLADNRPSAVSCLHPLVTLLEKFDAIHRRFLREDLPARAFIRHYEDAARIIAALETLPSAGIHPRALAEEMVELRQLRVLPDAADPAFVLGRNARSTEVREAHEAIEPLFFGKRVPIRKAADAISAWIGEHLG